MRRILLFALIIGVYISCKKSSTPDPTPPPPSQEDTLNGWYKQANSGIELEDIWFTDVKNGFVAGANGLYASTDSGNTWSGIAGTSGFRVFNMQFTDNLHGFVQGLSQMAVSVDGGKTWKQKSLPTSNAFTFQFITASTGYYSDYKKGLYKSVDTGNTWKSIFTGAVTDSNFIFNFLDSSAGFVMVNANFSNTVNGGTTWNPVASNITNPSFPSYYKMQFTDSLNGYCASPQGLFKTTDGGKTWQNKLARETTFMVPYFLDKNNGFCLAANTIYKTTDGGNQWTVSCQLAKDDFSGMHFLDMNTGWASTFGGLVLRLKP